MVAAQRAVEPLERELGAEVAELKAVFAPPEA